MYLQTHANTQVGRLVSSTLHERYRERSTEGARPTPYVVTSLFDLATELADGALPAVLGLTGHTFRDWVGMVAMRAMARGCDPAAKSLHMARMTMHEMQDCLGGHDLRLISQTADANLASELLRLYDARHIAPEHRGAFGDFIFAESERRIGDLLNQVSRQRRKRMQRELNAAARACSTAATVEHQKQATEAYLALLRQKLLELQPNEEEIVDAGTASLRKLIDDMFWSPSLWTRPD